MPGSSEDVQTVVEKFLLFLNSQAASSQASSSQVASSQGVTPSQQIAIAVAKKVIDSLVGNIKKNQPKFDELKSDAIRALAEAHDAQHKFEKFVFDSSLSTILESVSKGLTLN